MLEIERSLLDGRAYQYGVTPAITKFSEDFFGSDRVVVRRPPRRLCRGVFHSVPDLGAALEDHLKIYNEKHTSFSRSGRSVGR
jgi:hypothetical protein